MGSIATLVPGRLITFHFQNSNSQSVKPYILNNISVIELLVLEEIWLMTGEDEPDLHIFGRRASY